MPKRVKTPHGAHGSRRMPVATACRTDGVISTVLPKTQLCKKAESIVSMNAYARRVWAALDTPVSRRLIELADANRWDEIVRFSVDPSAYSAESPYAFFLDYQAVKLMAKCPGLKTGIDTKLVAARKFLECEQACKDTNSRWAVDASSHPSEVVGSVVERAKKIVSSVLGPVPDLCDLDFSFGPGATFGVRKDTSDWAKISSVLECTRTLLPLLPDFLGEFPGWFPDPTDVDPETRYDIEGQPVPDGWDPDEYYATMRKDWLKNRPVTHADIAIVQGSELTFVPKDAKTDRPICIEPTLNGLGQKGIGAYMKRRLLRWGVDLRDQGINQRLAANCLTSQLSTVDFSSASDTLSYSFVWSMLPLGWADLLDHFRCPRYRVENQWYNFQKFSSMGNAYTFELETLLFFALAVACCEQVGVTPLVGQNIHVYGDDVIIPREAFDLYVEVAAWCGFTVNQDKSYRDGNFFESCGTDYFAGWLVTPLRQKNELTVPEAVNLAANNIVRMAERLLDLACTAEESASARIRCASLAGVHRWTVTHLRSAWRVFGPAIATPSNSPSVVLEDPELGDSHIWAPWDFTAPRIGIFGYRYKMIVNVPSKRTPVEWLDDWEAYKNAYVPLGYATYKLREIKPPLYGWLTDDRPWEGHIEGYAVRGDTRRKRITAWARDWSFPCALAYWFFGE